MDEKQMTRACVEFLRRRLGHLAKGLLAEYEEQAAQRNAATLGARAKEERRVAAAAAAEARVLEAQADVQAAQAASPRAAALPRGPQGGLLPAAAQQAKSLIDKKQWRRARPMNDLLPKGASAIKLLYAVWLVRCAVRSRAS